MVKGIKGVAVVEAAKRGDAAGVARYFDGASAAELGSAFRRAVAQEHFGVASYLLGRGVSVDDVSRSCGYTALQNEVWSFAKGTQLRLDSITFLLNNQACPHFKAKYKRMQCSSSDFVERHCVDAGRKAACLALLRDKACCGCQASSQLLGGEKKSRSRSRSRSLLPGSIRLPCLAFIAVEQELVSTILRDGYKPQRLHFVRASSSMEAALATFWEPRGKQILKLSCIPPCKWKRAADGGFHIFTSRIPGELLQLCRGAEVQQPIHGSDTQFGKLHAQAPADESVVEVTSIKHKGSLVDGKLSALEAAFALLKDTLREGLAEVKEELAEESACSDATPLMCRDDILAELAVGAKKFDPAQCDTAWDDAVWREQVFELDVASLRQTHDAVNDVFLHGPHRGQRVQDLVGRLTRGETQIGEITPLVVIRVLGGDWVVFGNRRLKALKEYAHQSMRVVKVRCIVHEGRAKRDFPMHLFAKFLLATTTNNGGASASFYSERRGRN